MSAGPRIRVAGLLVNGGRVLLVRQEKEGRTYWLLPGGGVEEGEELVDALRRELAEECGWEPTAINGPVALVETIPPPEAPGGRHILHMIFAVEVEGKRSLSGLDPIRCRSSEVLPAPVVPTNSTRA